MSRRRSRWWGRRVHWKYIFYLFCTWFFSPSVRRHQQVDNRRVFSTLSLEGIVAHLMAHGSRVVAPQNRQSVKNQFQSMFTERGKVIKFSVDQCRARKKKLHDRRRDDAGTVGKLKNEVGALFRLKLMLKQHQNCQIYVNGCDPLNFQSEMIFWFFPT